MAANSTERVAAPDDCALMAACLVAANSTERAVPFAEARSDNNAFAVSNCIHPPTPPTCPMISDAPDVLHYDEACRSACH